jgi:amidophosphoribosyltransferase
MGDNIHENCGVAAVFIPNGSKYEGMAPQFLYRARLLDTHKDNGLVPEVFKESDKFMQDKIFEQLSGNKGIGHTRYATSGSDDKCNTQPFERVHGRKWKWFSFCFNGNIANYADLKKALTDKTDYHIMYDNDTEIMMHYFARELQKPSRPKIADVFAAVTRKFDGAYNIAYINAHGSLVVFRDPTGFRPMNYGYMEDVLLIASESNAIANFGVEEIRALQPGEMIKVENGSVEISQVAQPRRMARCMFEWVYFSNVASIFDGKSVYLSRTRLGEELAKLETLPVNKEEYLVVPVPDSAKPAGDAYAYALGLPSKEGLIRNRFAGRTFIEGKGREDKVRNKFTVQRDIVQGKKIILVDDSIVRGTTTKNIVKYLKEVGKAKEVHIRVSCPPIAAPCFYGIDMSSVSELFAPRFNIESAKPLPKETMDRMAAELHADSLIYQTISGLVRSISFPESELCLACLNRNYPTKHGAMLYNVALKNASEGIEQRAYERKIC